MRCGIGYDEELRGRVEAVCLRSELAFAAKLPNGDQVRDRVERTLELCTTNGHWSNAAFEKRYIEGASEAARHLGIPDWLLRTVLALRALRLSVSRHFRGVTRL
jgi:hypothetical protein